MTRATYAYEPDYAVPPGEILEEHLQALQMSQAELARRCNRSPKLISEIVSGKAPVEPETALQLEKALGVDARIWVGIESDYRLFLAREAERKEAEKQLAWAKNFPVNELVKRDAISKPSRKSELVGVVLRFFGVSSIDIWESAYSKKLVDSTAFRHSPSFESDKYALTSWLRLGEIQAEGIPTKPYDERAFIRALKKTRNLTAEGTAESLDIAQQLCGNAGVALAIVKPFPNTSLHAATRWISSRKALIQLTARHLRDDQLWFSLFHEAAHLLLHKKRQMYVQAKDQQGTDEEIQANRWAADFLIPRKDWRRFVSARAFDEGDILAFADKQQISPGIVVGRLQHEKKIHWSTFNDLRVSYIWGG